MNNFIGVAYWIAICIMIVVLDYNRRQTRRLSETTNEIIQQAMSVTTKCAADLREFRARLEKIEREKS